MLKLDKAHFGNPPKVEIGADGDTRYRGEADDLDNLSSALPVPLSSEMPTTEGHFIEVQPINVLNNMTPTVLRQVEEELTQSRLTPESTSP